MELEKYCWELDDRRPFRRFFAYIDAAENLADQLFIKHEVAVDFGPEFGKAGSDYFIIICSIRKKDRQRFLEALKEPAVEEEAALLPEQTETEEIPQFRELALLLRKSPNDDFGTSCGVNLHGLHKA